MSRPHLWVSRSGDGWLVHHSEAEARAVAEGAAAWDREQAESDAYGEWPDDAGDVLWGRLEIRGRVVWYPDPPPEEWEGTPEEWEGTLEREFGEWVLEVVK